MINNFGVLFNCTPMGRALKPMIASIKAQYVVRLGWTLICFLADRGPTGGLILLQCSSGVAGALGMLSPCFITVYSLILIVACDDTMMSQQTSMLAEQPTK